MTQCQGRVDDWVFAKLGWKRTAHHVAAGYLAIWSLHLGLEFRVYINEAAHQRSRMSSQKLSDRNRNILASLKQMASSVKIFLSCLFLFLLTTLQTTDAHQGTVPKVKHDTNLVQTSSIRCPPSGPNPEGNFEVNAASQDVGKQGAKVQNVDEASKELTGFTQS